MPKKHRKFLMKFKIIIKNEYKFFVEFFKLKKNIFKNLPSYSWYQEFDFDFDFNFNFNFF
jgi:hypothetical protein